MDENHAFCSILFQYIIQFIIWTLINLNSILPNYDHSRNLQSVIYNTGWNIHFSCYFCSILIYYSLRLKYCLIQQSINIHPNVIFFSDVLSYQLRGIEYHCMFQENPSQNVYIKSMDVIVCSGKEHLNYTD